MVKVSWDAGHGFNTPGKRTPDGEREWSFNDKVGRAFDAELKRHGVETLRCDDSTGKEDVSLTTRVKRSNSFEALVHVSIHQNANTAVWGNWGGTETFTYLGSQPKSERLAKAVHTKLVAAMGLRDRGLKKGNLYMIGDKINCPSILTEGAFMDSTTDIKKLRDEDALKAQGVAIAHGILEYFGIVIKAASSASKPTETNEKASTAENKEVVRMYKPNQEMINATCVVLNRLSSETHRGKAISKEWRDKLLKGELSLDDTVGLLYVALERGLIQGENK